MVDRFRDSVATDWAKKIKERDNYTCQLCGKYGIPLNSHHLYSWDMFEELRYDLSNGITLCFRCHSDFHLVWGSGRNTKYQFLQFQKTVAVIKKALRSKLIEESSNK